MSSAQGLGSEVKGYTARKFLITMKSFEKLEQKPLKSLLFLLYAHPLLQGRWERTEKAKKRELEYHIYITSKA